MSIFRKILSLFFAIMLASTPLLGWAEETVSASERGRKALLDTGHAAFLQFPEDADYLSEWKTLYARKAFRAPALEVKSVPTMEDSDHPNMPYLYEGTSVTVVAEHGDMSCMIYHGANNKPYCGWIKSIRLLEEFPGELLVSGMPRMMQYTVVDGPEVTWGEGGYQKFWHPYSALSQPVRRCIGFTLEYQLIDENTLKWDNIYGPRTIHINVGDHWEEIGSFSYPKKGAVRVQVWLEEPIDIFAVGTVAQCWEPDTFLFRQTVCDFCVVEP